MRTLLQMARGLPKDSPPYRSVPLSQLAHGCRWELTWQHGRALRAGAAELMAATCMASQGKRDACHFALLHPTAAL